ncbi:MAG TPA: CHAT domain-containing protein, partial [Thermoanaerobaculia bacterium]|nr:CHAT domain-containing protein [Thermoanaerobaculia bacterium]
MSPCRSALVFILLSAAAASAQADDALLDAVLTACRRPGDAHREAHCYFLSGMADIQSGNVEGARQHLNEAGQRLEAAGDPVAAWKAFWVLAEYERRFGRQPDLRVAATEKALGVVERAKRPNAPFRTDGLAELENILSGSPFTSSVRSRFLQLYEAVSRNGYAATLLAMGEVEKAETQLAIASQLVGPFGAMLDRSIARSIGQLRRRQWRLDEARESYRKALAAPKIRLPFTVDDRGEGDMAALHGLAEIEMLGGRTDAALGWNERALTVTRAAGEHGAEVSLLAQRAEILERGGHVAAAEQIYANALSIAATNGDVKGQATLLTDRASMYMDRGRYGAAIADSEKSLELVAAIDDPLLQAVLIANLARTYFNFAAQDSATSTLEKARTLADKTDSHLGGALVDVIVAGQAGTTADLKKALERFLQLREVRGMENMPQLAALLVAVTGPSPVADLNAVDRRGSFFEGKLSSVLEVMTLLNRSQFPAAREAAMRALAGNPSTVLRAVLLGDIAFTYAAEGKPEQSVAYARRASDALDLDLDAGLADDLLSGLLGQRQRLFGIVIETLALFARPQEAFEVTERARARAFLQLVGNRRIRPRSGDDRPIAREAEALRAQIAKWQLQARLAPSRELDEDLRGARRRYQGLRTRVKASDPEYSAVTGIEAAPLETIQNELPAATTLISYFVSGSAVHAWVLDRTTIEYVRLPVDDAWLKSAMCTAWQLGGRRRGVRVQDDTCNPVTVEELHERLFAPLRKHVRNQRLMIVPHLGLHYLPFAAFRNRETQHYLVEDYTITYAPSASALRFLREKETPVNGRALILGAPSGVLPALPGAMREAMSVAAELRSQPLLGAAAKESVLYQLNGDVDLIHIAAHG